MTELNLEGIFDMGYVPMSFDGIVKLKPTSILEEYWFPVLDTKQGDAWKCPDCGKRYIGVIKKCEYCGLKGN